MATTSKKAAEKRAKKEVQKRTDKKTVEMSRQIGAFRFGGLDIDPGFISGYRVKIEQSTDPDFPQGETYYMSVFMRSGASFNRGGSNDSDEGIELYNSFIEQIESLFESKDMVEFRDGNELWGIRKSSVCALEYGENERVDTTLSESDPGFRVRFKTVGVFMDGGTFFSATAENLSYGDLESGVESYKALVKDLQDGLTDEILYHG